MKKILFIAILALGLNACLPINKANAQITLVHRYDSASSSATAILGDNLGQLMIIDFAVSGEKYVKINRLGRYISIYNLNHTLLKNISLASLPLDGAGSIGTIFYLSENLFSTDSKIAFMYCYENTGTVYYTGIYEEDGTLIFSSDSAVPLVLVTAPLQQYPIYNTTNGSVMILSNINGQAEVYSLPGTLTTDIEEANKKLMAAQGISNPYPNPNNGSTRIDYTLPDGVNEGEIVFYNLQGMEVKRFKVDRTFNTLLISTKDIAAGTYYYQLQTSADNSGGKKMVVIK